MQTPAPIPAAPPAQGSLIAFRWDRLGARLITIVNTIRLAEDHGLPFCICWPRAIAMEAELNDPTELFAPDFVARHFGGIEELGDRRRAAVSLARAGDPAQVLASGRDVAVEMVSGVAVLPGEDPDRVTARCGEVFRALPWAEALRAPMAALGTGLAGATACHLRRGDTIRFSRAMQKPWPNKYVPEEFFRPHIEAALGAGRPVVVFSDDPALVTRLQRDYPGLRAAAELVPGGAGLTPAQRDMLELYAMSLCARIVAPEQSAFSATAATLSGRTHTDVMAALPAPVRAAAHAALLARVQERPDSFDGPGEIGQCVPHLVRWLEAEGRGPEAARLCAGLVRGGLDISFVSAAAMRLALAHGQPAEAVALADGALAARPPLVDRDLVACRLSEAAARAALGDRRGACRALLNAFALAPTEAALRRLVPLLAAAGALPAEAFLPHDPALIALIGPRLPLPQPGTPGAALAALIPPGAALPERGLADSLCVDWEPLLSARPLRDMLAREGGLPRALALAAAADGAAPAVRSMHALVLAESGAPEVALQRLHPVAAEAPDDALVLHRLSRVRALARQPLRACQAAERAVALAGLPAHHAWAGHVMQRIADRREAAAEHLRTAVAAEIGLPSVPVTLAAVERRLGRGDAALAALDLAARLAPNSGSVPLTRARYLFEDGDLAGARAALEPLVAQDRASAPAWRLLAEVEAAAGRPDAARAAVAEALSRKPGDTALQGLAATLG